MLRSAYDVIFNNCASFILRMFEALGYEMPVDDIVNFTSDKLHSNGQTVMAVRSSMNLQSLVGEEASGEVMEDRELLELLVRKYIAMESQK